MGVIGSSQVGHWWKIKIPGGGHRIIPGGSRLEKIKIPPGAHRIPGGIQYMYLSIYT